MKAFWLGPSIAAACIAILLGIMLAPYGGNSSALFHYGTDQETTSLPSGFVVLDLPSYDGALYYRIARQLPFIFSLEGRSTLATIEPKSYAYQRILLPAVAAIVSVGDIDLLPWTFLLANVTALFATAYILAKHGHHALAILALVLCPAAMLGLHFSLAEPLTIFLLTTFLLRQGEEKRVSPMDAVILSLAVLAREVNVLFVGFLIAWLFWHRRPLGAAWLLLPLAVFALWHSVIFSIFHEWPFFLSTDKRGFPLIAIWEVVSGMKGYNAYTFSSIALLFGFVVPTLLWTAWRAVRGDHSLSTLGALAFLLLMLCMPDHVWGSVTSIGRVITPVYPCAVLALTKRDSWPARGILSATLLLGLGVGLSLALNMHVFHFA